MPKPLRSSETAGCGATIELDNGEVVYVSIAQVGVLVRLWNMKGGLFKSLMSNFLGPKLYNESSVYKNAQTARALSIMFPDQAPSLRFKNPVLAAFANAIWHCSSAAEVSIILNEAGSRHAQQARPAASPRSDRRWVGKLAEESDTSGNSQEICRIPRKTLQILSSDLGRFASPLNSL